MMKNGCAFQLLEKDNSVGLMRGSAVEEFVRQVNPLLYEKAARSQTSFEPNMTIERAIVKLT